MSKFVTKFLKDDRLARIFEITRDLARERDLSRLLGRVTDHAMTLVRAERGSIVLVSEDGTLEAQVVRGVSSEEGRSYSRSVAERVVRTGEAIATTSARDDERLKSAAYRLIGKYDVAALPLELLEQRVDQLVLGRVVVVQVARADAQLAGDHRGGCVGLAKAVEQLQRRGQDAFGGAAGGLAGHGVQRGGWAGMAAAALGVGRAMAVLSLESTRSPSGSVIISRTGR